VPHSAFMRSVRFSGSTAIISVNWLNWLGFTVDTDCVLCEVRNNCVDESQVLDNKREMPANVQSMSHPRTGVHKSGAPGLPSE